MQCFHTEKSPVSPFYLSKIPEEPLTKLFLICHRKTGYTDKETIAVWINYVYNDSVQESHLFLLEGGY